LNEDKATRYHRLRRRASLLSLAAAGALLVAAVRGEWGRALAGATEVALRAAGVPPAWQPWASVAGVVLGLAALVEAVALPSAWYLGYVLPRRYGLSQQSAGEWLADHVKAGALGLVVSLAAAQGVYGAMRSWPGGWWVAAGLCLTGLTAVLVWLGPLVVLPLFYRFERITQPGIADRLVDLAGRAGARVFGVYRWSLGDKSRTANAALVGLGPTRRVLLSDTLLADYTPEEIEVILAHELAHHVHGDIWKGLLVEAAQTVVVLAVADVVLRRYGPAMGVAGVADPAGLPLLVLVAGACSVVLAPALNALSRRHERRADRFALDLTRNPGAFVSAMRRLGAQNLADESPSRLTEWLFHSHPPLAARIAAAQAWAAAASSPQQS
jgi:STE24 endopeptidase